MRADANREDGGSTRNRVLRSLFEASPMSCRDVIKRTGLSRGKVYACLDRCWRASLVLRTAEPTYEKERVFRGRAGSSAHIRPYHRYLLKPEGLDEASVDDVRFVGYSEEYLDSRGGGKLSKASRILHFLEENTTQAFFSNEIVEALGEKGVRSRDIMSNVRRFKRRGLVYVRGYKTDTRQTPFQEGYLLTFMDQKLPRDQAILEAVVRTEEALAGRASSSPTMERVHRIRNMVLEHTQLRKLLSPVYVETELGCSKYEAEHALEKILQLYPDVRVVKLFDAYRYLYHSSLGDEDLAAVVAMKRNYLRIEKGAANRVGHNWEAVAEWFIDRTTTGARFWTQSHREGGMDQRRITLHLLRGVGGRRQAAEVDQVWEVTPGVFAPPITYVLSCKWGLVSKGHVDDFMEVLRWSKDFGVDTPDGREIKNGVMGVFAASAFNPNESVRLKDETSISLASYAARRNLQLVTAADFNGKLRERGCPKEATVQKVCRASRDEAQVRETLDAIWDKPAEASGAIVELTGKNQDLFRFEKMLESEEDGSKLGAIPV